MGLVNGRPIDKPLEYGLFFIPGAFYPQYIDQLRSYPNIVQQLNHDKVATLTVLKAKGIGDTVRVDREFDICHEGILNLKTRADFPHFETMSLPASLLRVCAGVNDHFWFEEPRRKLTEYIQREYFNKLPRWPRPGQYTQSTSISLNIVNKYEFGPKLIIWRCVGTVQATDETPGLPWNQFKVRFSGEPNFNCIIVDLDKLRSVERMLEGNTFQQNLQQIQRLYREDDGF